MTDQAFPSVEHNGDGTYYRDLPGMTLRDYFAAAAMQGLLSQSGGNALVSPCDLGAEYAYRMANAMMEAREK